MASYLLARSIVVILRNRGGRFLVCERIEEGLFEGGDTNTLRVLLVLQRNVELLASQQAQSVLAKRPIWEALLVVPLLMMMTTLLVPVPFGSR
jgi:hypothetical protein